jgi:hypothetical protein
VQLDEMARPDSLHYDMSKEALTVEIDLREAS